MPIIGQGDSLYTPDLEDLIARQDGRTFEVKTHLKVPGNGIQKSDKCATLFDFIKMLNKVVTLTMKDLQVEFIPDEGRPLKLSPDEPIDHPYITYKVINRRSKIELKPRVRETIAEQLHDIESERLGEVYGQKFKCIVQFNIFASVYDVAEQVMEKFEELIFTYAGFFKKNGVGEILFEQQLTDSSYDSFRQITSVRNVQYYIEVEKLVPVFHEKIKEIETYLSLEKEA